MDKATLSNPKAYLIPYPVKSFSKPILIKHAPTFIGRSPDDDIHIQINDRRISRKHACISFNAGDFFIEDLNSQNGTYLNQERIQRARLNNRDKISISNLTYQFLRQTDPVHDAGTPPARDASETIAISLELISGIESDC